MGKSGEINYGGRGILTPNPAPLHFHGLLLRAMRGNLILLYQYEIATLYLPVTIASQSLNK